MDFASKEGKKKEGGSRKDTKRVQSWVEGRMNSLLEDSSLISQLMVQEVQCGDPDCVPIETVIMCFCSDKKTDETLRYIDKILKPMAEVVEQDVEDLQVPADLESLKKHLADLALLQLQDKEQEEEAASEWENAGGTKTKGKDKDKDKDKDEMAEYLSSEEYHTFLMGSGVTINPGDSLDGWLPYDGPPVIRTITAPKAKSSTISKEDKDFDSRHRKGGVRPQGCPCCDPDAVDAMIDSMFARGI